MKEGACTMCGLKNGADYGPADYGPADWVPAKEYEELASKYRRARREIADLTEKLVTPFAVKEPEHAAVKAELASLKLTLDATRQNRDYLIKELEASHKSRNLLLESMPAPDDRHLTAEQRANELADKCGDLTKALRDADHETAELRRELEKARGRRCER